MSSIECVEQSKRSAAWTVKAGLTIPRCTESRLGDCDLPSVPSTHVERDSITKRYPYPSLSVGNYLPTRFPLDLPPDSFSVPPRDASTHPSRHLRIKIHPDRSSIYVRLPRVHLRFPLAFHSMVKLRFNLRSKRLEFVILKRYLRYGSLHGSKYQTTSAYLQQKR